MGKLDRLDDRRGRRDVAPAGPPVQILVGIVDIINRDLHPSDADVIPTYACNGLSVSVIYGQAWDVTWRWRAQTGWTKIKGAPSAEP